MSFETQTSFILDKIPFSRAVHNGGTAVTGSLAFKSAPLLHKLRTAPKRSNSTATCKQDLPSTVLEVADFKDLTLLFSFLTLTVHLHLPHYPTKKRQPCRYHSEVIVETKFFCHRFH